MTVTTTYKWTSTVSSFLVNQVTGGDQTGPVVAAYPDGKYFVAWGDSLFAPSTIDGRIIGADGSPAGNEFQVNTTTTNAQFNPVVAQFNASSMIVAFVDQSADPDGDIRLRIFDQNGAPQGSDILVVGSSTFAAIRPAITGLRDGNAVVSWSDTTFDAVDFRILSPTGATVNGTSPGSVAQSFDHSTVAALAGSNFVVVYERTPYPGVENNDNVEIAFNRFNGVQKLDSTDVIVDNDGTINRNPHAVGLKDGGFAIAYEDNQYNLGGTEISLMILNADGSKRTSAPIRVNTTNTAGDQIGASITTLSNGFIVVGWQDSGNSALGFAQAFQPDGTPVGGNHVVAGGVFQSSLAALDGGRLANVWESTESDGDGHAIRSSVDELTRTITSDAASDTIAGGQDTLKDHFVGGGGTDTVTYAAAASAVTISLGNPTKNAGAAAGDTFSGVENLTGTKLGDRLSGDGGGNALMGLAGDDALSGGKGADVLTGGKGADTLKGGKGGDTLNGGKGADKLYAGKGDSHDVFVFGKHDSGTADGTFDRIYGFDRQSGNEKLHDVIDLSALHVTLGDIDLSVGKHSAKLLIDYHGSHKPDMVIEVMKIDDLNPGDLLL